MKKLRRLKWNEEYAVSFELDGKRFSTSFGRGWIVEFEAREEAERLKSKGAKKIRVYIQVWG